jgi:hypothetical protein
MPEFDWFLTPEFRDLRDNYKPQKYTETEKHKHEESARGASDDIVNSDNSGLNGCTSQQEVAIRLLKVIPCKQIDTVLHRETHRLLP